MFVYYSVCQRYATLSTINARICTRSIFSSRHCSISYVVIIIVFSKRMYYPRIERLQSQRQYLKFRSRFARESGHARATHVRDFSSCCRTHILSRSIGERVHWPTSSFGLVATIRKLYLAPKVFCARSLGY